MPGKPGVPYFGGRGNWIAGFRDFKSMGNPATTQQVGCGDATFGGDVVGGAPWNPPGASWGWRVGIFLGSQGAKIPSKQEVFSAWKPRYHIPWKWMVGRWNFLLKLCLFRKYASFRRGRYHLFGWGLLRSDLVMENPLREWKNPEWRDVSQNVEVGWR